MRRVNAGAHGTARLDRPARNSGPASPLSRDDGCRLAPPRRLLFLSPACYATPTTLGIGIKPLPHHHYQERNSWSLPPSAHPSCLPARRPPRLPSSSSSSPSRRSAGGRARSRIGGPPHVTSPAALPGLTPRRNRRLIDRKK